MRELCYNKDMKKPLYKNYIATPIGQMMSISDAEFLYRLDFTDQKDFQGKIASLDAPLLEHPTPLSVERNTKGQITQVFFDDQHEKTTYEDLNENQNFVLTTGTPFQQAVGQALARNPLPVVLPCHRVTRKDGSLGGFMGKEAAVDIKQSILNYEKSLDI